MLGCRGDAGLEADKQAGSAGLDTLLWGVAHKCMYKHRSCCVPH
jgi:hypothetical protein